MPATANRPAVSDTNRPAVSDSMVEAIVVAAYLQEVRR